MHLSFQSFDLPAESKVIDIAITKMRNSAGGYDEVRLTLVTKIISLVVKPLPIYLFTNTVHFQLELFPLISKLQKYFLSLNHWMRDHSVTITLFLSLHVFQNTWKFCV